MRHIRLSTVVAVSGAIVLSACTDSTAPMAPEAPDASQARAAIQANVDVIVVLDDGFAPGGHAANQRRAAAIARSLGAAPGHTYGTALFGFEISDDPDPVPGEVGSICQPELP